MSAKPIKKKPKPKNRLEHVNEKILENRPNIEDATSFLDRMLPTEPAPEPSPVGSPVKIAAAGSPAIEVANANIRGLGHNKSEQAIYELLVELADKAKNKEIRVGIPQMMKSLPAIRSDRTVRTALSGLISKKSIERVSYVPGQNFQPKYRIYQPLEVEQRRIDSGILVDRDTNQIVLS